LLEGQNVMTASSILVQFVFYQFKVKQKKTSSDFTVHTLSLHCHPKHKKWFGIKM